MFTAPPLPSAPFPSLFARRGDAVEELGEPPADGNTRQAGRKRQGRRGGAGQTLLSGPIIYGCMILVLACCGGVATFEPKRFTPGTDQIDHDLDHLAPHLPDQIDHALDHLAPHLPFERLCRICIMQIQPRKRVLNHADYTGPMRHHELDHIYNKMGNLPVRSSGNR